MFRMLISTTAILAFSHASAAQSLIPESARTQKAQGPSEPVVPLDVRPSVAGGPQKIVYRVSGLRDTGGQVTPDISSFISCTSFSTVAEDVRVFATGYQGTIFADLTVTVPARNTVTFSTHEILMFSDISLNTGVISQGSAFVLATNTNILCTAGIVNAATYAVDGIALHMQRFTPFPGSVE